MKASDLYRMVQEDPTLKVVVEILADLAGRHKEFETPSTAAWQHSEEESHRFFSEKDFRKVVSIHMIQAPLDVSEKEVLTKLVTTIAIIPHPDEDYVEITKLGWEVAAFYLIGRHTDPKYQAEYQEQQRKLRKIESEMQKKLWEQLFDTAKQSVQEYMDGGSLEKAINSMVALKHGRYGWGLREGEWSGEYLMTDLLRDLIKSKESDVADFDYSMPAYWGDKPAIPKQTTVYNPNLVEVFLPLWQGIQYYIPELKSTFFEDIVYYTWATDSILEQSFVHYLKTGNAVSYSIALMATDSIVERMLEGSTRGSVYLWMDDLDTTLNRLGLYLGGIQLYKEQYCQFLKDVFERHPFLREEIPIIEEVMYINEIYNESCE